MRMNRTILTLVLSVVLPAVGFAEAARERVSVQAIMVAASKERGDSDRRLASYEPTLRRILRFESYRFLGEDSATITAPGRGTVSPGQGHRLDLEVEQADGGGVRVRVRWSDGGQSVMSTSLVLRRGVPAVLGGPSIGDHGEVCAMIVIAR